MSAQLDALDAIAERLAGNDAREGWGVLSTGEKLYVALAANRVDLLAALNYSIPEALARVGETWTRELVSRWQYR